MSKKEFNEFMNQIIDKYDFKNNFSVETTIDDKEFTGYYFHFGFGKKRISDYDIVPYPINRNNYCMNMVFDEAIYSIALFLEEQKQGKKISFLDFHKSLE